MKQRKKIYALLMAMVYIIATVLSSASLLLCDHHHAPSYHTEHHACACGCEDVTLTADCCNHHHPILGDNHTDYIDSSQRNDSRTSLASLLMLAPVVMPSVEEISCPESTLRTMYYGGDEVPLMAAFISCRSLRAPPALA